MDKKFEDFEPVNPKAIEELRPSMPQPDVLLDLSEFFKVMGDGTRLNLLWALENGELCVGDLAILLDMTKSAISHQLRSLRQAKLVSARRDGKNIYYSLNDSHVKEILEMAMEQISE